MFFCRAYPEHGQCDAAQQLFFEPAWYFHWAGGNFFLDAVFRILWRDCLYRYCALYGRETSHRCCSGVAANLSEQEEDDKTPMLLKA